MALVNLNVSIYSIVMKYAEYGALYGVYYQVTSFHHQSALIPGEWMSGSGAPDEA